MGNKWEWLKFKVFSRNDSENDRDYRDRLLVIFMVIVLALLRNH